MSAQLHFSPTRTFHPIWWQNRSCLQRPSGRARVGLSLQSDAEPDAARVVGAPAGPSLQASPVLGPQHLQPFAEHRLCAELGAEPSPAATALLGKGTMTVPISQMGGGRGGRCSPDSAKELRHGVSLPETMIQ